MADKTKIEWCYGIQTVRKPRSIFWCSLGDLFHEKVPTEFIDRCFAVMAMTPEHQHIVLTKRAKGILLYLKDPDVGPRVADCALRAGWCKDEYGEDDDLIYSQIMTDFLQGFSNIHLGVTAENQARWDERVTVLAELAGGGPDRHSLGDGGWNTFVSIEPMLGEIRLKAEGRGLKGIIVGGESGPGARPMHPDWVRSIRDQCASAGVPFYFKQWGTARLHRDERGDQEIRGAGGKKGGRMLDGRTHDALPWVERQEKEKP